jgi:hypothetical protein
MMPTLADNIVRAVTIQIKYELSSFLMHSKFACRMLQDNDEAVKPKKELQPIQRT